MSDELEPPRKREVAVVIRVRVYPSDLRAYVRAAEAREKPLSTWIREAARCMADAEIAQAEAESRRWRKR